MSELMESEECEGSQETDSTFDYFMQKLKPTAEDLQRELTNDQLVELCLKKTSRVRMELWNPVNDYVLRFREQGRLTNKTPKAINDLLKKAVNRHKRTHSYTESQINEWRKKDWEERKKYHLLHVDLWEYERQKEKEKEKSTITQCDEHEKEDEDEEYNTQSLSLAMHINTESITVNTEDLLESEPPDIPIGANIEVSEIPNTGQTDYDDFNQFIPLTSTQSQQQSEQIQVD